MESSFASASVSPVTRYCNYPRFRCGTTDSQRFPSTLVTDPKDGGGNRQGGTRLRVTVEKA